MGKDSECILAPNNCEHKTKHSFFMNAKDIMGQIKLRLEIKKQKECAKIKVISKGKLKPLKSILVKKNSNELEHKESGNVSVKTGCIKRVMINEVTKCTSFNQESFRLHKKNTKFVRNFSIDERKSIPIINPLKQKRRNIRSSSESLADVIQSCKTQIPETYSHQKISLPKIFKTQSENRVVSLETQSNEQLLPLESLNNDLNSWLINSSQSENSVNSLSGVQTPNRECNQKPEQVKVPKLNIELAKMHSCNELERFQYIKISKEKPPVSKKSVSKKDELTELLDYNNKKSKVAMSCNQLSLPCILKKTNLNTRYL